MEQREEEAPREICSFPQGETGFFNEHFFSLSQAACAGNATDSLKQFRLFRKKHWFKNQNIFFLFQSNGGRGGSTTPLSPSGGGFSSGNGGGGGGGGGGDGIRRVGGNEKEMKKRDGRYTRASVVMVVAYLVSVRFPVYSIPVYKKCHFDFKFPEYPKKNYFLKKSFGIKTTVSHEKKENTVFLNFLAFVTLIWSFPAIQENYFYFTIWIFYLGVQRPPPDTQLHGALPQLRAVSRREFKFDMLQVCPYVGKFGFPPHILAWKPRR